MAIPNIPPFIAIIMEGGIIQNVCTNNDDIKVVIVDYDAFENGDPPVWEEQTQLLEHPLSEDLTNSDTSSWKELEVALQLNKLGY